MRIGSNAIIGACSLITKDVPGNSVVAGVPAKVISSFEEYLKKRTEDDKRYSEFGTECVSGEMEERCWREFLNGRNILNKSV